jgi:putative membrane protein
MPGERSERTFFEPGARERVTAAIKEIEAQTSAEVVVAVRKASGSYRDVDYLVGFAASLAGLLVLLFHPYEFATEGMPLEVVAAFAVGSLLCANAPPLRRALTPRKRLEASCLLAARAAFVELGVGRTRERDGIFVLVSLFERRVTLVADIGIDPAKLGTDWGARVAALEASLAQGASVDRFVEALRALGPVLSATMPHRPEDTNELSDEVAE